MKNTHGALTFPMYFAYNIRSSDFIFLSVSRKIVTESGGAFFESFNFLVDKLLAFWIMLTPVVKARDGYNKIS